NSHPGAVYAAAPQYRSAGSNGFDTAQKLSQLNSPSYDTTIGFAEFLSDERFSFLEAILARDRTPKAGFLDAGSNRSPLCLLRKTAMQILVPSYEIGRAHV